MYKQTHLPARISKRVFRIHSQETALRNDVLRLLEILILGLTDLSDQREGQEVCVEIPLPEGYESRRVLQLERSGLWDVKGHFTHYIDLKTNDLLLTLTLAMDCQPGARIEEDQLSVTLPL